LDDDGNLVGILGVNQDITEHKRLEQQILRSERLVTLGKLTGTVSHELRNPLGTIRNTLMVVDAKTRDQGIGVEGALDRIARNIRRCDDIISELFDYATCRPIKRQDTSLDAWLAAVLDDLAVPEGITVRRALGDADAKVTMDRERMRRVMFNLCDNACQAMTDERDEEVVDKERILTIGTEAAGNEVKISVTDTGTGMSQDTVAQIFEPLFSTKIFGVGLGLCIVKQIIEQHGGTLEVTSEEGRGTTFVVGLPMVRAGGEAS
jgi:signal transduction histidine kinase